MRDGNTACQDIVEYWRTIEIFSPQKIPAVNEAQWIYRVKPGRPLPWEGREPDKREKLPEDKVWRYEVYCGIYSLEILFEALKQVCGSDPDSFNDFGYEDAALAGFVLNEKGVPIADTAILSSCAWGMGRAAMYGAGQYWVDGFDNALAAFKGGFAELLLRNGSSDKRVEILAQLAKFILGLNGTEILDDVQEMVESLWSQLQELPADGSPSAPSRAPTLPAVTHDLLDSIIDELKIVTNTEEVLGDVDLDVRIKCTQVTKKANDEPTNTEFDFMNSMLLADLATVAEQENYGPALQQYLAEAPSTEGRVDVRQSPHEVFRLARPERIPLGRWPAKSEHPLALNQQLAVNNALAELRDGAGVMGVNGPPGTGKTTLLRDMIAALITDRASAIARLSRPKEGFSGTSVHWKNNRGSWSFSPLVDQLVGYEMVVASSNNGAVDNVTKEIPRKSSIDPQWINVVDFFGDIGTTVLNADNINRKKGPWEEAWALTAAKLGRSKNRSDFSAAFWFGIPADKRGQNSHKGMSALLRELKGAVPAEPWRVATERFRNAESRVAGMRSARQKAYQNWCDHQPAKQLHASAVTEAARATESHLKIAERQSEHDSVLEAATAEFENRRSDRDRHSERKPGLLDIVFTLGRAIRDWYAEDREFAQRLHQAHDHHQRVQTKHRTVSEELRTAEVRATAAKAAEERARDHLSAVERALEKDRLWLGNAYPANWDDRVSREQSAPWADPEFNAARSELFLEALRLHRSFIEHNADTFSKGLNSAVDAVTGSMPGDVPPEVRLAAWQVLFLAVPVVSTTFASLGRQFDGIGASALGWLFIDEAGQATPQNAVGGVWRSRRVLAVGDPLQLEPVVSVPLSVQQSLRVHADVSERWVPEWTSVQRLADDITSVGTFMPGPGQAADLWVGTPLSVHRRCDDPMAEISNTVAYDGMMIVATPPTPLTLHDKDVPHSKWIDIVSSGNDGHWIPAEGDHLDKQLGWLERAGFDMSEVILIGPFRDVARELSKRKKKFGLKSAGTIHTAQGKEADVVILVLGGDPEKSGAMAWAAKKPNLVNVAVSRAKRRLYVIGDYSRWSGLTHFNVLADRLELYQN